MSQEATGLNTSSASGGSSKVCKEPLAFGFIVSLSGPLLTVSKSVPLAVSGKQKACLPTFGWPHILSHSSSLLLPLSHLRLQLALFYDFEILEGGTVMDSNVDA